MLKKYFLFKALFLIVIAFSESIGQNIIDRSRIFVYHIEKNIVNKKNNLSTAEIYTDFKLLTKNDSNFRNKTIKSHRVLMNSTATKYTGLKGKMPLSIRMIEIDTLNAEQTLHTLKKLYGSDYIVKFDTVMSLNGCNSNLSFPNDINISGRDNRPLFNKLSVLCAWDISKGDNIKVAVLDVLGDGIHEDLNGIILKRDNLAQNTLNDHGTAVAGCISSSSNNNLGISSVGGNTKLMLYNIASNIPGTINPTLADAAFYEAIADGAKVINCSFNHSNSQALNSAITNDVTVVVAAGNFGVRNGMCLNPNVICVTNVDSSDSHATDNGLYDNGLPKPYHYSGPEVDISAPDRWQWTTSSNNQYGQTYNGTSFASPIVAGIVALIRNANPCLTSSQVKQIIERTADDVYNIPANAPFNAQLGAGRINAYAAVKEAATTFIQNQTLPNFMIGTNKAFIDIGSNITNTIPYGPVSLQSGTTWTINAREVYIQNDFTVPLGAELTINTNPAAPLGCP